MHGRKIYAVGEIVYDIIFRDKLPLASNAGGAMLNTTVSLGRLGVPVQLISELGCDGLGNNILDFLSDNGVGTKYIHRFKEGNTALALAFLDENNDAEYSFYKNYPAERLNNKLPLIKKNDLLLFGSFFSIMTEVRKPLLKIIEKGVKSGALIVYDPNFRKPHVNNLKETRGLIIENIRFADIVRGSHEDFKLIFGTHDPVDTYNEVKKYGNPILIYTKGGDKVVLYTGSNTIHSKVPEALLVSTIGAGDNFNAGLLYSLYKLKVNREDLPYLKARDWKAIIESCITFGTIVCESYENYISKEFAEKLYR